MFKMLTNMFNFPSTWKDAVIVEELEYNMTNTIYEISIGGGSTYATVFESQLNGALRDLQAGDHVKVMLINDKNIKSTIVWVKKRKKS